MLKQQDFVARQIGGSTGVAWPFSRYGAVTNGETRSVRITKYTPRAASGRVNLGLVLNRVANKETSTMLLGQFLSRRIQATPGICGGSPRIAGTRVPVWVIESQRQLGMGIDDFLLDYPFLQDIDIQAAWHYADEHQREIAAEIVANEGE